MSKPFTAEDFADIFEEFFGGTRTRPNGDFQLRLALTIQEGLQGIEKTVTYERLVSCQTCEATGAAPGATATICGKCQGAGQVRTTQQTLIGSVVRVQPCDKCKGLGRKVSKPCPNCLGKGRVSQQENIRVQIPAGVKLGTPIQFDGMGSISSDNKQYGSLFIKITFSGDKRLKPEGDDIMLYWQMNAHDYEAGKKIRVPALDGDVLITLPEMARMEGKLLRLRGLGLPDGQGRGDQLIQIEIRSWQRSLESMQKTLNDWLERLTQGKRKNKEKTMPIIDVEFSMVENPL